MTARTGDFIRTIAILGVVTLAWGTSAFATPTVITRFSGSVPPLSASGGTASAVAPWTRTITEFSPNEPGGGTIQAVYVISVTYNPGDNAQAVANAFKAACIATLPMAMSNPNGYGVVAENSMAPSIRVGKQTGNYSFVDAGIPPGIVLTNIVPANAEHAPAVSPAGLVALAAGLSSVAWWARRRRVTV